MLPVEQTGSLLKKWIICMVRGFLRISRLKIFMDGFIYTYAGIILYLKVTIFLVVYAFIYGKKLYLLSL